MNRRVCLLIGLLLLCMLFTACSNTEKQKEQCAEQFLQACFTLNKDHRFDVLEQATEEGLPQLAADSGELQAVPSEIYDAYYQGMKEITTEDCLASLEQNRIPGSYDRLLADAGLTARIDTIGLTPAGDGAYTFAITYDSDQVNTLLNAPITGRITVREENGTVLVGALRIDSK